MATCGGCGARLTASDGQCGQCGAPRETPPDLSVPAVPDGESTAGVQIDPERLLVAPRPDAADPAPGAWGPAEGPAPPARPAVASIAPSANRRSGRPAAKRERAAEPEAPQEEAAAAEERPQTPESRPPPLLASASLRRELAPATPSERSARVLAACLGILGAGTALWLFGGVGPAIPVAGTFLGIALLGLTPMPYPARASALTLLCGGALALSTYRRIENWDAPDGVVLTVAVTVLGTALLYRAWHRGSLVARVLVAAGIAACCGWLGMVGALEDMTTLPLAWQSWAPRVLQVPFALLLMLSLLAFMDARSTGGCGGWAGLLFAWFTGYVGVGLLSRYWPPGSSGLALGRVAPEQALAILVSPLLMVLLCHGLAQLLAVAMAAEEPAAIPVIRSDARQPAV